MPSLELGEFIAFLAVPTVSLLFLGKIRSWGFTGYLLFLGVGGLSFLLLGGASLAFASGYEIVTTTNYYNQTGGLIGSVSTPVMADFAPMWSYVFLGASIVFGLIYFKVMISGAP